MLRLNISEEAVRFLMSAGLLLLPPLENPVVDDDKDDDDELDVSRLERLFVDLCLWSPLPSSAPVVSS